MSGQPLSAVAAVRPAEVTAPRSRPLFGRLGAPTDGHRRADVTDLLTAQEVILRWCGILPTVHSGDSVPLSMGMLGVVRFSVIH